MSALSSTTPCSADDGPESKLLFLVEMFPSLDPSAILKEIQQAGPTASMPGLVDRCLELQRDAEAKATTVCHVVNMF